MGCRVVTVERTPGVLITLCVTIRVLRSSWESGSKISDVPRYPLLHWDGEEDGVVGRDEIQRVNVNNNRQCECE